FEIAAFIGKNSNRSAVIPAQAGIRLVRFRFFLRFRATSKPSFPRRRESRLSGICSGLLKNALP
ncbi:TPA: hypothetical protein ACM24Q_002339, partial [Neisseria meningitidis]